MESMYIYCEFGTQNADHKIQLLGTGNADEATVIL